MYRWLARRLADVSRVHTIQYTVIPVGISYSAAISSLRPPSMRRVRLRSTSINIYLYEYSCSVFRVTLPAYIACHRSRICHLIRSAPSADVAVSEYPIAIQLYRVYTYITTAYYKYIPTQATLPNAAIILLKKPTRLAPFLFSTASIPSATAAARESCAEIRESSVHAPKEVGTAADKLN